MAPHYDTQSMEESVGRQTMNPPSGRAFGAGWGLLCTGVLLMAGAPTWWRGQGAPSLNEVHQEVLNRLGTPYIQQAYFLDVDAIRRTASSEDDPLRLCLEGKAWIGIRMRFLQAVGSKTRRAILEAQVKRCWKGQGGAFERGAVRRFLDHSARALNEGDGVEYLYGPGPGFWVRYGTEAPRAFDDPDLKRCMLTLEFSRDPENPQQNTPFERALKGLVARP
jgi:hypothetical protein